jgi:hypothetical protein
MKLAMSHGNDDYKYNYIYKVEGNGEWHYPATLHIGGLNSWK